MKITMNIVFIIRLFSIIRIVENFYSNIRII